MQGRDDELYTTMFNALRHGVRRKILRILSKRKVSFTYLLNELEISSSHLTYHLDALGELISKDESLYILSVFGKAAVDMMSNIEDPPRHYFQDKPGEIFKYITIMLLVLFVISSGLVVNLMKIQAYQQDILDSQSAEIESLTEKLEPLQRFNELDSLIISNPEIQVTSKTSLWLPSSTGSRYSESILLIYVPENNRVLELDIMANIPADFILPLTVQKGNALLNESAINVPEEYKYNESVRWMSEIEWSNTRSNLETYNIILSEKGWYIISLAGPVTITGTGKPVIQPLCDKLNPWNDPDNIRIWAECRLLYGRTPISFGYIRLNSITLPNNSE